MRIVRFRDGTGTVRYGTLEGDMIEVAGGDPLGGLVAGSTRVPLAEVKLLTPILFMKSTTAVIEPDEPVVIP